LIIFILENLVRAIWQAIQVEGIYDKLPKCCIAISNINRYLLKPNKSFVVVAVWYWGLNSELQFAREALSTD
jgi:hypothetical protein